MSDEPAGTFTCPVCGHDKPHHHPADSIRWHERYLPDFISYAPDKYMTSERGPMGDEVRFHDPELQLLWRFYQTGVRAILAQWEKGHEIDACDLLNALKWRVDNQRKQLARLQSERDGLEIQMAQMATVAARQEHRFTALEAQLAEARPDPLIKAKDEAWLRKVTAERDALKDQLAEARDDVKLALDGLMPGYLADKLNTIARLEEARETAWLIELNDNGTPWYWCAFPDPRAIGGFDKDVNKATRFSREQDAKGMAVFLHSKRAIAFEMDMRRIRITEHVWRAALSPAKGEGT